MFKILSSFFQNYSEPSFKSVSRISKDIEIRNYDKSIWFSTSFIAKDTDIFEEDKILSGLFDILFKFISRNNFNMTKPVIIIYKDIPSIGLEIEMMFFYSNLSGPDNMIYKDDLVKIVYKEGVQVSAIKFGGFPGVYDFIKKRKELTNCLGDKLKKYKNDCLVTASYGYFFTFL
jgi:hypothetical protein